MEPEQPKPVRFATIKTARLTLRNWRPADRDDFAHLNADPEVMEDLGGPLDRARSDAKFDRYVAAFAECGFSRWALEDSTGEFVGYTGVMPSAANHPLGRHAEIGWRIARRAWGNGYAPEAARAALTDVFTRTTLTAILSYTSPENVRSRAVMERLGLRRAADQDFTWYENWRGLVWVAARTDFAE
jgi:RimJ/RimL family protein N-acetyltransferase